jgi:hypothetical protein
MHRLLYLTDKQNFGNKMVSTSGEPERQVQSEETWEIVSRLRCNSTEGRLSINI